MDKITIETDAGFKKWWEGTAIRKDDQSLLYVAVSAWNACKEHYDIVAGYEEEQE